MIVRDLLAGPRRFSDLRRSLGITPTWRTARLRALEANAIVTRDLDDDREGWYRLTPKGEALAPVIDASVVWGMDHALGQSRAGEVIHPRPRDRRTVRYLDHRGVRTARPTIWVIRFGDDRSCTIRFDGARWSRQRGDGAADVIVQTSPAEWVTFLGADVDGRRRWLRKRDATGTRQRLDELATAFGSAHETSSRTRR